MRRAGGDPAAILRRVSVSRAYTCHQLLGAAEALLGPLAGAAAEGDVLAAILGVDRLFIDEDLPLWERRYLFDAILTRAETLRRQGLPILITYGGEASSPWARAIAGRARMLPELADAEEPRERIGPA
jgi:hypothetical protein